MPIATRRGFLQAGFLGAACACAGGGLAFAQTPAGPSPSGKYVCPPCGCAADGKDFDAPGTCPECGMNLVPKPADKGGAPSPPKGGEGGSSLASRDPQSP